MKALGLILAVLCASAQAQNVKSVQIFDQELPGDYFNVQVTGAFKVNVKKGTAVVTVKVSHDDKDPPYNPGGPAPILTHEQDVAVDGLRYDAATKEVSIRGTVCAVRKTWGLVTYYKETGNCSFRSSIKTKTDDDGVSVSHKLQAKLVLNYYAN